LLFLIVVTTRMMTVSTAGINHQADIFSGPEGMEQSGLWELSIVVMVTTVGAPVLYLLGNVWVLLQLRGANPQRYLRRIFASLQRIRPWAMIDVFLVGLFVAYSKLRELADIDIGTGLWALVALMLSSITLDALLDGEAVWREMERRGIASPGAGDPTQIPARPVGCEVCGLLCDGASERDCPRCGSTLHKRLPDSINRTWALALSALILYFPANLYPVLTYNRFGAGVPSTILGGVAELMGAHEYLLAGIVFAASIAVPCLKLCGLFLMLLTTQRGLASHLHRRTRLYRVVELIGRWSMIDIFVDSILVALVQFNGIVTIEPGAGAVAFAAVVILTMLAAESFDPRLMWDAAEPRARRRRVAAGSQP
jgi:paraquat-inducible protein A